MANFPLKDLLGKWKKNNEKALRTKSESYLYGQDENGNDVPIKVNQDGTVPTQVTGSKDEYVLPTKDKTKNIEVIAKDEDIGDNTYLASGEQKTVLETVDVSDYKSLIVHFYPVAEGDEMDYKVSLFYKGGDRNTTMQAITAIDVKNKTTNQTSDRIDVVFMSTSVKLENNSNDDHQFGKIYLLGVRK